MTFGQRLRQLRIDRGYRQEDVASLLKISFSAIEKYEMDKRTPTLKKAKMIADFFGISVHELMGDSIIPKDELKKKAALASKYSDTIDALESMDPKVREELLKRIKSAADLFPQEDAATLLQKAR